MKNLKNDFIASVLVSQVLVLPISIGMALVEYFHIDTHPRTTHSREFAQLDTFEDVANYWFNHWLVMSVIGFFFALWLVLKSKQPNKPGRKI